jgi:hypothetical protein
MDCPKYGFASDPSVAVIGAVKQLPQPLEDVSELVDPFAMNVHGTLLSEFYKFQF